MDTNNQAFPTRISLRLNKHLVVFLFAFVLYFSISTLGGPPFRLTLTPYFNYLADAFIHGQLNLRLPLSSTHDLVLFNGNYYLYWPPMPAVILMPFITLFGVTFSDVFFCVIVGSINVTVVAAILFESSRKHIFKLDEKQQTLLILFFTLGTVHVSLAPYGGVWFTSQVLGFLFVGLAYLSAIKLKGSISFFVVGLCVACAMLTRSNLLFTGIWPAYHLVSKHWKDRPKLYWNAALALLPALILGMLFLAYNFARFGNPFDLGIHYHNMSSFFVEDYKKYGYFNAHYIPINIYYQYIFYPLPLTNESLMGGALFLLSPVFFYAFRGIYRSYRSPKVVFLLASILISNIPILLLMGTGWVTYGPRYTLDFAIPLLMLTAMGIESTSKWPLVALTILSIVQYVPGIILLTHLSR